MTFVSQFMHLPIYFYALYYTFVLGTWQLYPSTFAMYLSSTQVHFAKPCTCTCRCTCPNPVMIMLLLAVVENI